MRIIFKHLVDKTSHNPAQTTTHCRTGIICNRLQYNSQVMLFSMFLETKPKQTKKPYLLLVHKTDIADSYFSAQEVSIISI